MKISVVTVCYNAAATLPATLESVLHQRDVELDYQVVDGGSTDGTVDLLRRWEARFRAAGVAFTWTSEPDAGIYDAMNKGLFRATGDVLGILNADDRFEDETALADVARAFSVSEDGASLQLVYGDVRFVRGAGTETVRYYSSRPWRPWMHAWGYMPAHPSVYVRRTAFIASGGYRTDYRISADFEWMTRLLCRQRIAARYLPRCFVVMRLGGASTGGLRALVRLNCENVRANRENGFFCCLPMMLPKYIYKVLGYFLKRGENR